jgi:hypothetical protein
MWTRIFPTSNVVAVAKSPKPPLIVNLHDSGPGAFTLERGDAPGKGR